MASSFLVGSLLVASGLLTHEEKSLVCLTTSPDALSFRMISTLHNSDELIRRNDTSRNLPVVRSILGLRLTIPALSRTVALG